MSTEPTNPILSTSPILEVKNLSLSYGKRQILRNLHFQIPEKSITVFLGSSGCGKSTLLKSLNGLLLENKEASMEGEIFLSGENLTNKKEKRLEQIAMVFQNPSPFPFSIYKNMTYALEYYGIKNKAEQKELILQKLEDVGLLEEISGELHRSALSLSGGQAQRLCIARALCIEPKILLLDEPCSSLDRLSTLKIEELLQNLKERYSMIIVTHNLSEAKRIGDQILFFHEGELWESGTKEEFFTHPKRPETKEFIEGEW